MNEWNRTELADFLDREGIGLLYFYTPLCGTCQVASRMLQIVGELVEVTMGKMNLNFYPDLAKNFAIESVPSLLIIRNGEVQETIYAFHSVPFLLEKIKFYFG
ncbi:thiol reductase thioredoxin [Bacillus sp. AFS076308]|uniref:thioredoxin family protein n=1 Tax=unclassified Bacillus (in: firmicutes) TaxID=185979 RepID=UPI000BF9A4E8|nr:MULTISPECIES: thioredoxin family protein [unclassified Bacillus (in: firmicutes)]PFN82908.1 thiol reductase thioredoxin [Bacillus sp. AFS076308]PGV55451.1 thiol reductase thioredoxin [Bacillus sp. AFS037270]